MPKEKPELSDAMRKKMSGKSPIRNPIKGTKFTIAISSAKGGVGKSTFATNLHYKTHATSLISLAFYGIPSHCYCGRHKHVPPDATAWRWAAGCKRRR